MAVSNAYTDAVNHHADAYVWDSSSGNGHLIDVIFINAANASGKTGSGGRADVAEGRKFAQCLSDFPLLTAKNSFAREYLRRV